MQRISFSLTQRWAAFLCVVCWACSVGAVDTRGANEFVGKSFDARDSIGEIEESSDDARRCLQGHAWKPAGFEVKIESAEGTSGDLLVRFPSPVETGDAVNDRVAMEWYLARDEKLQPIKAPAVVVVHESGKGMTVGRKFAVGLRSMGLHTLMVQLPDYGHRRSDEKGDDIGRLILHMRQGIADVRRARDAVAALPMIDAETISVQGTSLGGFVAANAAALDGSFDGVFLMLAGGDLYDLVENGAKDAAKVREELKSLGVTDERLKEILWRVEPNRIAHRLPAERTWLYSGKNDTVVPIKNAESLAEAARLDPSHHIQFRADHYSGVIYLPMVLSHIRKQIHAE